MTNEEIWAFDNALLLVRNEMIRMRSLHAPIHSGHEAWGLIAEEVREAEDEIKNNDLVKAKEEWVQVAALACVAVAEVTK